MSDMEEFAELLEGLSDIVTMRVVNRYMKSPCSGHPSESARRAGLVKIIADETKRIVVEESDEGARLVTFSKIAPEPVEWVWKGYIPKGVVTLIDGLPGTGKSTLALELAARVTTGKQMPDDSDGTPPGTVIILSAEDDPARAIRPRLDAAGADTSRCFQLEIGRDEHSREFQITVEDVRQLEALALEKRAVLIIVDPLVAFMSANVETNSDHSVRRALVLLRGLAQRTGAAVVCIRHWSKRATGDAVVQGGGSIAYIGAARHALAVAEDPGDAEKAVVAVAKSNLIQKYPSLSFQLVAVPDSWVARVEWCGVSPLTADELARPKIEPRAPGKLDLARDLLREQLREAPKEEELLEALAENMDISVKTLRRAKDAEGVVSRKGVGVGAPWFWQYPNVTSEAGEWNPENDEKLADALTKLSDAQLRALQTLKR